MRPSATLSTKRRLQWDPRVNCCSCRSNLWGWVITMNQVDSETTIMTMEKQSLNPSDESLVKCKYGLRKRPKVLLKPSPCACMATHLHTVFKKEERHFWKFEFSSLLLFLSSPLNSAVHWPLTPLIHSALFLYILRSDTSNVFVCSFLCIPPCYSHQELLQWFCLCVHWMHTNNWCKIRDLCNLKLFNTVLSDWHTSIWEHIGATRGWNWKATIKLKHVYKKETFAHYLAKALVAQ